MKIVKFTVIALLFAVIFITFVTSHKSKKGKLRKFHKMAKFHNAHKVAKTHKSHKSHKSHTHTRTHKYDPKFSPEVIKTVLELELDTEKSDCRKDFIPTCFDRMVFNPGLEKLRKSFWETLEKVALEDNKKLTGLQLQQFFDGITSEVVSSQNANEKVKCGDCFKECLKDDKTLISDLQVEKVKQELKNSMGIYSEDVKKNNDNFITSFASYFRDSSLRHPDLFKKLNRRE